MPERISEIVKILREKRGMDISVYDETYLRKTVNARSSMLKAESLREYIAVLEKSDNEALILADGLNNVYSEFFRNPLTFDFIEQFLIPWIVRKGGCESGELRVWSAGCASGQEAYSLAISAYDSVCRHHEEIQPRVFGTDKSAREIESAKKGVYASTQLKNARLEYIEKYMSVKGDVFSVNPGIRSIISFSVFDLITNSYMSPPESIYGNFNIIMCSNLLFYYKEKVRNVIISKLLNSLDSKGFIITGEAEINTFESVSGLKRYSPFVPVFVKVN